MSKFILKRIFAPFLNWMVKRKNHDIIEFGGAWFIMISFVVAMIGAIISVNILFFMYVLMATVIPLGFIGAISDLYGRYFIKKKEYDLHGQHCETVSKGYNFWLYWLTKLLTFFYRDNIMVLQQQHYDWVIEQGYDSKYIMPTIPNDFYVNNICMSALREIDVYGYKETMLLSSVQSVIVLFEKEDVVITKLYIQ